MTKAQEVYERVEALVASGDLAGAVSAFRAALASRPDWAALEARLSEVQARAAGSATSDR